MINESPELKKAHEQQLKLNKTISALKVEAGSIRNQIDKVLNDPEQFEIVNKVKEQESIIADMRHREKKLMQLNDFQYEGVVKVSIVPTEAYLEEITEKE